MPATTDIIDRVNACRAILICTDDPRGQAWNKLTPGYRAALLKVAEIPVYLRESRWKELPQATCERLIHTALAADGLQRFINAVQSLTSPTPGETLQ